VQKNCNQVLNIHIKQGVHNLFTSLNVVTRRIKQIVYAEHTGQERKCIEHFGWKILREETTWECGIKWEECSCSHLVQCDVL